MMNPCGFVYVTNTVLRSSCTRVQELRKAGRLPLFMSHHQGQYTSVRYA